MAHFAELNKNNIVIAVIVVENDKLKDGEIYSELKGIEHLQNVFGEKRIFRQTSYNGNFRGKFAAIGDRFDAVNDIFITPEI
jgi:uncharacterized membrane protein YfbV (UPF0208 family)